MEAAPITASTVKLRKEMRDAIDTRKKLLEDRSGLETEYAAQTGRARKAGMVAADLQMMPQVFSIAGAVHRASSPLNQDTGSVAPVDSRATLSKTAAKIGAASAATAKLILKQIAENDVQERV